MNEDNAYSFFPGCLIRARLPHIEKSARIVLERLGVELSEMEGASCCPNPVNFRDLDHEAWLTLAARNLSIARETRDDPLLGLLQHVPRG